MLIKGGKLIKYGINQIRYSRGLSYFDSSLHAEVDLIRKTPAEDLVGGKIYVYRFNNTTCPNARQPKISQPCPLCQHMLHDARIGKVTYINRENVLTTTKGRDLGKMIGHPPDITRLFAHSQQANQNMRFSPSDFMYDGN